MNPISIWNSLKGFFTKDNIIWTLLVVSILFIFLNIQSCNENNKIKQEAKQNIEAARGELKQEKDKNGVLTNSIAVYSTDLKTLQTQNKELYDVVVSQNGKILFASKTIAEIKGIVGTWQHPPTGDPGTSTFTIDNLKKGIKDVLPFAYLDTLSPDYKHIFTGDVIYSAKYDGMTDRLKVINEGMLPKTNSTTLSWAGTIRRNEKGIIETTITNSRMGILDMKGVIVDEQSLIREQERKRQFGAGISAGVGPSFDLSGTFKGIVLYIGFAFNINLYPFLEF